jgi:hypothetical protein
MFIMTDTRRASYTLAALVTLALLPAAASAQRDAGEQKPSLSLRANPPVGFTPLRVRATVDVRGGADDYADFYCPSIEWDWGDGTSSESSADCDPYEAGRSSIQRRWSAEHVYRQSGGFRIVFKLKQKSRQIAAANANIQVRPGMRDEAE